MTTTFASMGGRVLRPWSASPLLPLGLCVTNALVGSVGVRVMAAAASAADAPTDVLHALGGRAD